MPWPTAPARLGEGVITISYRQAQCPDPAPCPAGWTKRHFIKKQCYKGWLPLMALLVLSCLSATMKCDIRFCGPTYSLDFQTSKSETFHSTVSAQTRDPSPSSWSQASHSASLNLSFLICKKKERMRDGDRGRRERAGERKREGERERRKDNKIPFSQLCCEHYKTQYMGVSGTE